MQWNFEIAHEVEESYIGYKCGLQYLAWNKALIQANDAIFQRFSNTPASSNVFCEEVRC